MVEESDDVKPDLALRRGRHLFLGHSTRVEASVNRPNTTTQSRDGRVPRPFQGWGPRKGHLVLSC